jgi:hypothetical protein
MRLGINLPGPFSASVNIRDNTKGSDSGVVAAIGFGILIVYFMIHFWYITVPIVVFILLVRWYLRARRSKQHAAGTRSRK